MQSSRALHYAKLKPTPGLEMQDERSQQPETYVSLVCIKSPSDKLLVAVRLIGSHLFLGKKKKKAVVFNHILTLIFHLVFLCLLPSQSKHKHSLMLFFSTFSVFPFGFISHFPSVHSVFHLCVLAPVLPDLLGAAGVHTLCPGGIVLKALSRGQSALGEPWQELFFLWGCSCDFVGSFFVGSVGD